MTRFTVLLLLGGVSASGCDSVLPAAPPDQEVLAGPLENLTPAQMASHIEGDERFARVFSPAEGLGPLFVATSCEGCHVGDGKGHEVTTLTRFGRFTAGVFDPMRSFGGPQLQHRAVAGYQAERIPREATGITRLMAPAVTGLGFLEAVPDNALLALADPFDQDGDGVSGVPNWIELPDFIDPPPGAATNAGRYIGRFGKKAGAFDLVHQTANAYAEDMGLTTDLIPRDNENHLVGRGTGDTVPDPEVASSEFQNVVFYIRTLKAPPRRNADDQMVVTGERIFEQTGCASCHVPELVTGPSELADLDRVSFRPYTDLLMHDMGRELDDGYTEGTALTSEWRTPPLWGLGLAADSQGGRARFLHDGRASSLQEAILLHGGEGARSRAAFEKLSPDEKKELLAFLESL